MRLSPTFAAWLFFLAGFAALCGFAAAFDRFPADVWLARRLQDVHATAFARALDWTEDLVDTPRVIAVYAGATAVLIALSHRLEAFLLLVSVAARLLNTGVKEIVDRPRPSPSLVEVSNTPGDPSFPSGHADAAMVLYGLLFYLITLFVANRGLRLAGQLVCLWVIVVTGMERVYAGAHWPSDVLGGFYLGALVLAALIGAHRAILAPRQ